MLELTQDQARRITLRRQGLIEAFKDPFDAVRAMIAVQTQYAFSLPVAVAARTRKPPKDWDTRSLVQGGELVKSWSVRHTLHAHTPEDHALLLGVVGGRFHERFAGWVRDSGYDPEAIEQKIMEAIADAPLNRRELHERIPELKTMEWAGWGMDVKGVAFRQRLCIVGVGAEQRFASYRPLELEASAEALAIRYLQSYGPATLGDFRHWSGLSMVASKAAFKAIQPDVTEVSIEGLPGTRFVAGDAVVEDGPIETRFLAKFDPLLLAYHDRSLFIRPEDLPRIYRIAGQVEAVVLSGGMAVATWRIARTAKQTTFTIEPFRLPSKRLWHSINGQARRLAARLHLPEPNVEWRYPPLVPPS